MKLPFRVRSPSYYRRHPSNTRGRAWKTKKGVAYKDFDGDGKVNRFDCRPLNPRRQDSIGSWSMDDEFNLNWVMAKRTKGQIYGIGGHRA